jgi:hypothetical protein
MRRFLIYYMGKENESGIDSEIIIKADDMEKALKEFKKQVKGYKSITTITELTYV